MRVLRRVGPRCSPSGGKASRLRCVKVTGGEDGQPPPTPTPSDEMEAPWPAGGGERWQRSRESSCREAAGGSASPGGRRGTAAPRVGTSPRGPLPGVWPAAQDEPSRCLEERGGQASGRPSSLGKPKPFTSLALRLLPSQWGPPVDADGAHLGSRGAPPSLSGWAVQELTVRHGRQSRCLQPSTSCAHAETFEPMSTYVLFAWVVSRDRGRGQGTQKVGSRLHRGTGSRLPASSLVLCGMRPRRQWSPNSYHQD